MGINKCTHDEKFSVCFPPRLAYAIARRADQLLLPMEINAFPPAMHRR
jgi:hypothetical protein